MTVRCVLIPADNRAFQRHVLFRYRRVHWLYVGMLALLLSVTWFGAPPEDSTAVKISGFLGTTVIFGVLIGVLLLVARFTGSRFRGTVGDHLFEISEQGITEVNDNGRIETHNNGIRSIDETDDYFFVVTKTGLGHVIPKHALQTADEIRSLQTAIRARKA